MNTCTAIIRNSYRRVSVVGSIRRQQILGIRTVFGTSPCCSSANTDADADADVGGGNNNDTNASKDYFQIMNIKRSFNISHKELKANYKQLMRQYHPDKHTLQPQAEQDTAAQQATTVTHGYETLQDDHDRALHLLELGGAPMEDTISGNVVGHAILMEVMELREEVDCAKSVEELKPLREDNEKRIEDTCQELGEAFERNDLEEATRLTAVLQYWKRIDERISEKS